ncbi:MarR family winged helix-turn-helix transcriptional regulator [Puia dinghuensis]|uniref:HTH marR-type domain-containing protein n=1 Tax=Puia dinghuensis TaxID=1792502 RepID=A0A8J2UI32_9BACT|nr:MarR family transcriptional regulator [Puia dinghuensis]GGB20536.1 hypothetical protein GCM10011511_50330 [Puia dinghuensis]
MNRKQEHPVPPIVIALVGGLYQRVWKECDRMFREQDFPLEMDQIPVFLMLYYQGEGKSQQEICSQLTRDKASVNRTVAFLAKNELVKVTPDAADKRKTKVELTATGKKLASQAHAALEEFNASLASVLTAEEKQVFHTVMMKLIEAISPLPFKLSI